MLNEIIKNIVLMVFTAISVFLINKANRIIFKNFFQKNMSVRYKFDYIYLVKIAVSGKIKQENVSSMLLFLALVFLLVVGVGVFPFTSNLWIQGNFYFVRYINISNDFIILSSIILLIHFIEDGFMFSGENKNLSNTTITNYIFNMLFLINTASLMLFFRSTDISNMIQFQEGDSTDFFGNLGLIKNPFLFASSFFLLLLFNRNVSFADARERSLKMIIVKNLKMYLSSQYLVYFFMGGYSLFILPESVLDDIPLLFNVSQLLSLLFKMVVVYTILKYFNEKVSEFGSLGFRNFYMKLSFRLALVGFILEVGKEGLYAIL